MIIYTPLLKNMKERSISLEQLQEMIGYNQTVKSKLNNGGYVSLETIDKICNALKLPVEEVIKVTEGEQISSRDDMKMKVDWDKVFAIANEKGISAYRMSKECHQSVSYIPKAKERNAALPKRVFDALVKCLECDKEDICF